MRKRLLLLAAVLAPVVLVAGPALATGPSGSTECHIQDDDCDTRFDEDTGTAADDNDGDGRIDEDPPDGLDNDGDGAVDEDPADDDGDGAVDEDPPGDALDDPGENQVACSGEDVGGVTSVYAADNGAEICGEDSSPLPLNGRIIVTTDQGGYVAADGDNSNAEPGNGYLRVDGGGVHCGDEQNQDSTGEDQSGNTSEDCGASE